MISCGSRLIRRPVFGASRIDFQTLGEQRFDALDQRLCTDDRRQRIVLELTQADAEQAFGFQQQFDFVEVQRQLVRLELAGQLIERRRQFGNRQYAGHRGAALERMQGALQFVAGLQRHMLGGLIEETVEAGEVGFGFVAEDLQQQRIERRDIVDVFGGQRLVTLGQRMGTGGELIDIVALALVVGGEFADQFRQQQHRVGEQLLHHRARARRFVRARG